MSPVKDWRLLVQTQARIMNGLQISALAVQDKCWVHKVFSGEARQPSMILLASHVNVHSGRTFIAEQEEGSSQLWKHH